MHLKKKKALWRGEPRQLSNYSFALWHYHLDYVRRHSTFSHLYNRKYSLTRLQSFWLRSLSPPPPELAGELRGPAHLNWKTLLRPQWMERTKKKLEVMKYWPTIQTDSQLSHWIGTKLLSTDFSVVRRLVFSTLELFCWFWILECSLEQLINVHFTRVWLVLGSCVRSPLLLNVRNF